jgi:hypothetical protein
MCIAMNYTLCQPKFGKVVDTGKWAHKSCAGEGEEDVTSVHICACCTKTVNYRRAPFCPMGSFRLAPRME